MYGIGDFLIRYLIRALTDPAACSPAVDCSVTEPNVLYNNYYSFFKTFSAPDLQADGFPGKTS